jgi:outer membrane protein TolC
MEAALTRKWCGRATPHPSSRTVKPALTLGGRSLLSLYFSPIFIAFVHSLACVGIGAEEPSTNSAGGLTVSELVRRVVQHNESIQMKMLEADISRKIEQAEHGIFEPQVVGSLERVDSRRPNNTQQLLSLGLSGATQLNEQNSIYSGGLEFLAPWGAKIQTGYSLRELNNNLQRGAGNEFETFVGASVVQPLLKNFGRAATMARIRLAALASDVAFQEYRRQLMLVFAQAEAAYWDLYLSQEQERISRESVAMAAKIFEDNKARSLVGKGSELEVLQAQAGLSLRKSRQNEASLKVFEGASRLGSYFSDTTIGANASVRVVDRPDLQPISTELLDSLKLAYESNPDLLIRKKQVSQEELRVAYARNQRLPQLNLKGSYGFNGLGESPGESHDKIWDREFPAWSVGLEMRIPATGGIKEKREWEAARLTMTRALLALRELEVQIANSLKAALQKVRTYLENARGYQTIVDFHQKLLEAQLARLEVGSADSKTVLETEEQLFAAKVNSVESLVLSRKAVLELELVRGSTLSVRNMEQTKAQLHQRTSALLQSGQWTDSRLEGLQGQALRELDPDARVQEEAIRVLRSKIDEERRSRDPVKSVAP